MSIYDVNWAVGAHTQFSGKISDTLRTSISQGMYATQFFMGNPQAFKRAVIDHTDIAESKRIISRFPLHVFSHFPYISNLAGSTQQLAWSGDSVQDAKTTTILKSLEYELSVISNFNSKRNGVVIHPGNFKDRAKGLETIAASINKLSFTSDAKLILENAAGQGVSLATTFDEIASIINGVAPSKQANIGVCIDTCHLFAYGDYNLSEVSEVDRMFSDFDRIVGLNRLTLLHLNDSETPLKSRVDRHASLGEGYIWKEGFDSLVYLLDRCKSLDVPVVLETTTLDMLTLAGLRS